MSGYLYYKALFDDPVLHTHPPHTHTETHTTHTVTYTPPHAHIHTHHHPPTHTLANSSGGIMGGFSQKQL